MSKKKKKKAKSAAPRCPYCGKPAKLISAAGILPPQSKVSKVYACGDYPECDVYVCVHPGTDVAMGTLADAKLRRLRQEAHRCFDRLYKDGLMSKTDAYAWLADRTWLPRQQAHIGCFGEYHCQLVIQECRGLLAERSHSVSTLHRT